MLVTMQLLGITFILYLLELSAGNGFPFILYDLYITTTTTTSPAATTTTKTIFISNKIFTNNTITTTTIAKDVAWENEHEPITRSVQLNHTPVTAFSQTDLFLV